jgi:hypothetical protein
MYCQAFIYGSAEDFSLLAGLYGSRAWKSRRNSYLGVFITTEIARGAVSLIIPGMGKATATNNELKANTPTYPGPLTAVNMKKEPAIARSAPTGSRNRAKGKARYQNRKKITDNPQTVFIDRGILPMTIRRRGNNTRAYPSLPSNSSGKNINLNGDIIRLTIFLRIGSISRLLLKCSSKGVVCQERKIESKNGKTGLPVTIHE